MAIDLTARPWEAEKERQRGVVEGGDGGGGCCGGDRRRVRGGEEKFEVAGTEEIGGVSIISGGEVGFGDDWHAETPREPAG